MSKSIWEVTPFLKYSQFSTRLLVILALCVSIIAGIVAKKINKNWFIVGLCFLTIAYTILNWGNRGTIPTIQDEYLKKEFDIKPDISGLEPSSPIWADLKKSQLRTKPKANIEILQGNAATKETARTPISHRYQINAFSSINIKENTLYFPGWTVEANKKLVSVNYSNPDFPGVISFDLPEGNYNVEVKFVDLPIIIFSKWLSLISLIILAIYSKASGKYWPFFPKSVF